MVKIAISINEDIVRKIDRLVKKKIYPSRSRAIQEAVEEKMMREDKDRLAKECLKLDVSEEVVMAEEGMKVELEEWPNF